MIIYVVTELGIYGMNSVETYSRVFAKLGSARAYLKKKADNFIECEKDGFSDPVIERDEDNFCMYEDGRFLENSYSIYIRMDTLYEDDEEEE